jgi:hypothetical protein
MLEIGQQTPILVRSGSDLLILVEAQIGGFWP